MEQGSCSTFDSLFPFFSSTSPPLQPFLCTFSSSPRLTGSGFSAPPDFGSTRLVHPYLYPSITTNTICRASEYKFPDPIPEFADAETEKFKAHLHKKLLKKEVCGDSIEEVVAVCTEIFSTFLHSEYGGPGTLLVIPFIDMSDTISERGLPGGPQAARVAVKWAQDYVDKDWKEWNEGNNN